MVAIGTHVYDGSPGLASVIGVLGNRYDNYIAALSAQSALSMQQDHSQEPVVTYIRVNTTRPTQQVPAVPQPTRFETVGSKQYENYNSFKNHNNPFDFNRNQVEANFVAQSEIRKDFQNQIKPFQSGSSQVDITRSKSFTGSQDQYALGLNPNGVQARPDVRGITDNTLGNYQSQIDSIRRSQMTSGDAAAKVSHYDNEFFEILKVGIRFSSPALSNILDVHQPIVLGTIGSAAGALAGAVLSAAGKFAVDSSALVHEFREGLPYDGIVERAILGEAAFCLVMSMKRTKLEEKGILSEMAKVVKRVAPSY